MDTKQKVRLALIGLALAVLLPIIPLKHFIAVLLVVTSLYFIRSLPEDKTHPEKAHRRAILTAIACLALLGIVAHGCEKKGFFKAQQSDNYFRYGRARPRRLPAR